MALSVSCTCHALVKASAEYCGYLCYPSDVVRQWPLWSNPLPLSLIWCIYVIPLFLGCCAIRHMVLIALKCGKVLRLPLRSYRQYNQLSQFRFDRYFVRRGSPVLTFFPLDQTNWLFKLLDLYSPQRFCEQVHRVILPWDMTYHDSFIFDLFLYIVIANIHMLDLCLLCWIHC